MAWSVEYDPIPSRKILVVATQKERRSGDIPPNCIEVKIIGGVLYRVSFPGVTFLFEPPIQDRLRGIRPDMILITTAVAESRDDESHRCMTYTRFIADAYQIERHIVGGVQDVFEYR